MSNEEKARAIIGKNCKKENCLECGGRLSAKKGCAKFRQIMKMAKWKDDKFYTILACVKYSFDIQGFDGEQFVEDMKKQWEDD